MTPEREYKITYRGVDPFFTVGSSIAPFDPPKSAVIPAIIDQAVVACSKGGVSKNIEAATVEENEDLMSDITPLPDSPLSFGDSAGGCSLLRNQ